ncbi:MAG: FKBP-type peptidyl-prolyl cis-trans isomerase [Bacteroidaceae bacterium]|nr:FKBP-type peptidyl-prolyl cis-trans isomerase [Bacteroidaceae bacterium]
MKQLRYIVGILGFVLMGAIISCSEVDEDSIMDKWPELNDAVCDSLLREAGSNLFSQAADTAKVDAMPIGKIFGIETRVSTTKNKEYVFCAKLTSTNGRHPIYTDNVSAFYRGSYILGTEFDGNFEGYVATDTDFDGTKKLPAVYDTPTTFPIQSTSTQGLIPGWIAALQYMREGERWLLYVPCRSGYGVKSTSSTILDNSTLFFDIILDEIVD